MISESKYNGIYADCYVLCENRNVEFIINFLDYFLPERKEVADEYEFPQYIDKTEFIFNKDLEIINFLTKNTNFEYAIYWSNVKNEDLKGVMIFFTNDGKIILGLYCETLCDSTKIEDKHFEKLKSFSKSEFGYITYEQPAELNTTEFINISKKINS